MFKSESGIFIFVNADLQFNVLASLNIGGVSIVTCNVEFWITLLPGADAEIEFKFPELAGDGVTVYVLLC
jgi:hypothetical protein